MRRHYAWLLISYAPSLLGCGKSKWPPRYYFEDGPCPRCIKPRSMKPSNEQPRQKAEMASLEAKWGCPRSRIVSASVRQHHATFKPRVNLDSNICRIMDKDPSIPGPRIHRKHVRLKDLALQDALKHLLRGPAEDVDCIVGSDRLSRRSARDPAITTTTCPWSRIAAPHASSPVVSQLHR